MNYPQSSSDTAKPVESTLRLYQKHQQMAVDFEWEGKYEEAFRHYRIASTFKQRHDAGDLHEPAF